MQGSFRVLAIGACCPSGLINALKTGFKEVVHIDRTLHATCSCFISQCTIQVPILGAAQAVVKSYMKSRLDDTELQQVELEIRLHHKLTDRYAVPFWIAVEDSSQIHIFSKFCAEGDLRQRMTAGRMSESCVRDQVILPLLHVLLDMHSKGFVHRDLKPENVLMCGDHVLLGDFGLAVALPEQAVGQDATVANSQIAQKHGPGVHSVAHDGRSISRLSSDDGLLQDIGSSSTSTSSTSTSSGCCPMDSSTSGGGNHPVGAFSALKRASASSSDVNGLADCSGNNTGLASQQCRVSGIGMRRSSSAGSAGVWGLSAMPQLPNEVAGGTPAYSAPEIVRAAFNSTPAAAAVGPQNDIWALGVVAVECLTGQHPFGDEDMSPYAFMFNIIGNKQPALQQLSVTDPCKAWLARALERDPSKRASAQQLLQHEWVSMQLKHEQLLTSAVPDAVESGQQMTTAQEQILQQQPKQQKSWQQQTSYPVQHLGGLDGCLTADLLKLSGLTGAEAAASSWQVVGEYERSCQGHEEHYQAAAVCGSGCGSATTASIAADKQGCNDWPTQLTSGCCVLESTCRLQHYNSCPTAGRGVGICAQQLQQSPSASFAFLATIGSWED